MNPLNALAAAESDHTVPAHHARSWLLVPGTRRDRFDEAIASPADAVIIDIEDAVDESRKPEARQDVLGWLEDADAWVRVNDALSEFWADDLEALVESKGLLGVILAKAETPDQVVHTYHRLGGRVPVVPLVESAKGLEAAAEIAAAEGALRLAFGSGDFRRDTGMWASREAMAYARSRLTVASRAAGLPGAIDGPTTEESLRMLREQSEWTLEHGMTGKLALRAEQCAVINEVICPQPSEIQWAQDFLAEFEAAGGQIRDGSDPPRLGRADKILRLADAFGLLAEAD